MIAWFYAVGTGIGGIVGRLVFGYLIASGERADVFAGYALGGALMLAAAFLSVNAARRSLESVAAPLSLYIDPDAKAASPGQEATFNLRRP